MESQEKLLQRKRKMEKEKKPYLVTSPKKNLDSSQSLTIQSLNKQQKKIGTKKNPRKDNEKCIQMSKLVSTSVQTSDYNPKLFDCREEKEHSVFSEKIRTLVQHLITYARKHLNNIVNEDQTSILLKELIEQEMKSMDIQEIPSEFYHEFGTIITSELFYKYLLIITYSNVVTGHFSGKKIRFLSDFNINELDWIEDNEPLGLLKKDYFLTFLYHQEDGNNLSNVLHLEKDEIRELNNQIFNDKNLNKNFLIEVATSNAAIDAYQQLLNKVGVNETPNLKETITQIINEIKFYSVPLPANTSAKTIHDKSVFIKNEFYDMDFKTEYDAVILTTCLHEISHHLLRTLYNKNFFMLTNFTYPEKKMNKKENKIEYINKECKESGTFIDLLLHNNEEKYCLPNSKYLMDITNWDKSQTEFLEKYLEMRKRLKDEDFQRGVVAKKNGGRVRRLGCAFIARRSIIIESEDKDDDENFP